MKLADRMSRIQPSPTLAITAKAKELVAAGVDVISFGAGEPDFPTPAPIRDAAKQALDDGHTGYIAVAGLPALREAIAADYQRRQRTVKGSEVLVSTGGKHSLYNATLACFQAGDTVIVPAPFWVSYPEQIRLADATPLHMSTSIDNDFKIQPAQLDEALAKGARGLILCSPSNPTGSVYSSQELRALGAVLQKYEEVTVFFDAIYDRLYYDGEIAPDFAHVNPKLADRTITFNGFSKTYAMTGWRLGYAIGNPDVISAMTKLQSQATSNATTFAQYGALAALSLPDSVIDEMKSVFARRRTLIVEALSSIDGIECARPDGAFYVFPDASAFIGEDAPFADDLALAKYLLEEGNVAVVPGSAFGAPGCMRLSYATGDEKISAGVERIANALRART